MEKQLLLISSSQYQGGEYMAHCADAIKNFLGTMSKDEKIAFVPYAKKDYNFYTSIASKKLAELGYNLESTHTYKNPNDLITAPSTKAIFVWGGNTFRLLNELHKKGIYQTIKNAVENNGVKYMGISAGTNMACPTIMTTNDMPIALPPNFNAFGFIDYQINAHFIPGRLLQGHMGETRETRINEYHEENSLPVIGLKENDWIVVNGKISKLFGESESCIFEKGKDIRVWKPGTQLML